MVVNFEQLANINPIFVTFLTSNELTSTVWSALQLKNMLFISVTFFVLNELRSSEVSDKHMVNILLIFVTVKVLRFSSPSMVFSFERL